MARDVKDADPRILFSSLFSFFFLTAFGFKHFQYSSLFLHLITTPRVFLKITILIPVLRQEDVHRYPFLGEFQVRVQLKTAV